MSRADLLDLDTLVAVKKAAPQVTVVAFDLACWVVRGMNEFSKLNKASIDQNGCLYWQGTVQELHAACHFEFEVSFNQVGRACREMGLESWRKADGYHVAWSSTQLEILKKYFKA